MYSSQYLQNKTNYNRIMRGGFFDKNISDERERQQQAEVLRQQQAEVLRQRQAEMLQRRENEVARRQAESERISMEREQRERELREQLQRTDPARAALLQGSIDSVANITDFDSDEMPAPLPLTRSG
jgi:hypothetical protein